VSPKSSAKPREGRLSENYYKDDPILNLYGVIAENAGQERKEIA
jgi:hypothetical protein